VPQRITAKLSTREYLPLARSPSNSARIFSSSPTLEGLPFAQPWVGHLVTPDRASKLRALRSVTCASRMQLINMRTAAVFFLVICRLRRFGIGTRPYGCGGRVKPTRCNLRMEWVDSQEKSALLGCRSILIGHQGRRAIPSVQS